MNVSASLLRQLSLLGAFLLALELGGNRPHTLTSPLSRPGACLLMCTAPYLVRLAVPLVLSPPYL